MSDCNCKICGKSIEIKPHEIKKRKLCGSEECYKEDKRLAMGAFRATEIGKIRVKLDNQRYKRPDIDKICQICGEWFKTARKNRYICSKAECQNKGKYLRMKRYRANKKGASIYV